VTTRPREKNSGSYTLSGMRLRRMRWVMLPVYRKQLIKTSKSQYIGLSAIFRSAVVHKAKDEEEDERGT
jgi:hypothetical protein